MFGRIRLFIKSCKDSEELHLSEHERLRAEDVALATFIKNQMKTNHLLAASFSKCVKTIGDLGRRIEGLERRN